MSKEIMLRKIGNSQGIILPKPLVSKYNLDRVMIEDTGDGLFIRPVKSNGTFQKKLAELKTQQLQVEQEMKQAAENTDVQACYEKVSAVGEEVDLEIID